MKEIIIEYPMRNVSIAALKVGQILRRNNLNSIGYANAQYRTTYLFDDSAVLPEQSELEKMLKELNLRSIKVIELGLAHASKT